ncbi:hypothetical protein GGF37_003503 [Kickxella alabastrina]|nr:hypothetical protein GGF37_003503 [Kickxella alabastrina]
MLPEHISLDLEPGRVRRILRKILGKLSDIEEEVALQPSVYKTNSGSSATDNSHIFNGSGLNRPTLQRANSAADMPPAHPFRHLLPKAHRQPRYTYRRRSGYRSSDGNGSDGSDASIDFTSSTGAKRRGNIGGSKTRAGQFVRSSSLGSLSDSDAAGTSGSTIGKDPALWLTTPRKRPRVRSPINSDISAAAKTLLAETQTKSFASRLENLIPQRSKQPMNTFKARGLLTHLVQLGETLWLCRPQISSGVSWTARVLPLKVQAAFRLGEAIACSEDSDDLDYIDEIYSAIPPFLTRFVLWHHVVAMCYLRTPAYADTLAEALWQVGAVAQQEWLIYMRLGRFKSVSALVMPENMAPLHLRAIDIGTGMRFVKSMLKLLVAERRRLAGETTDVHLLATKSLWYQFVPTGCTVDASDEDDSGERASDGSFSAQMDAAVPSRYAKWVARMGDLAQSTLVLAEALDQALQFISLQLSPGSGHGLPALENSWYVRQAVEAVRAICSMIYTRLGCMAPDAAMGGIDMAVSGGLWQCVSLLAAFTSSMAQPGRSSADCATRTMKQGGLGQETLSMCTMYRSGLTLLALRQLKLCALGSDTPDDSWHAARARTELTRVAKSDLRRLCETIALPNPSAMPLEGGPSRRGLIAARFNSLMESTLHLSGGYRGPDSQFAARILNTLVMPLAVAGSSPVLFHDLARIIGMDLRCPRVARTIVDLVSLRFDAIWAHHSECSVWQRDWSRLQNTGVCVVDAIPGANGPVASHADPACVQDEPSIVKAGGCGIDDCVYGNSRERALRQLRVLGDDLERRQAEKARAALAAKDRADRVTKPAPTESVSIPAPAPETASKSALGSSIFGKVEEDELGFMLLRRRRSRANQR